MDSCRFLRDIHCAMARRLETGASTATYIVMNAIDFLTGPAMNMLYDSDSYVVVHVQPTEGEAPIEPHLPVLARHGFEIVDKRSGKEVYLDGSWAELFQQQIVAWQLNTPTQEEVEDTLEGYAELAQNPVRVH